MNILWQLTLRNLRLNRKRTIVTQIGIILSGAMICGVATLVASFQDVMIREAIHSNGSHHATFYGVKYEDVGYIANHVNTEEHILSQELGYAPLAGSKNTGKPYLWIHAYDDAAFEHYPVHLKEGRYPEQPGEIAVSSGTLYSAGVEFKLGDTITLDIGQRVDETGNPLSATTRLSDTESLVNLAPHTFIVTGIIEQSNLESYRTPAFAAFTYLDNSALSPDDLVDVALIAKNVKHIVTTVESLTSTIQPDGIAYNSTLLRLVGVTNNADLRNMIETVGLIIISLVVIGSVAVIYNSFAISVSERKKQFGMLASVGATARQIRRIVFLEATLLGAIGIPLGILSGIGGIWATLEVVNNLISSSFLGTELEMRLIVLPYTVWISVLFMALTIFLSVYIPAKRAARISPIDAIRLTTDINIRGKKLRTSRLTRLLFGIEGELALKNQKRHRNRYRATVFSLFISIVLYMSFSSLMTYGFASGDVYYGDRGYDFAVYKQGIPLEEIKVFYDQILQLDPVERPVISRSLFLEGIDLRYDQLGDYLQSRYGEASGGGSMGETYSLEIHLMTVGDAELQRYAEQLGLDIALLADESEARGILINYRKTNTTPITEYEPLNIQTGESLTLRAYPDEGGEQPESFTVEVAAISKELPLSWSGVGGPAAGLIITESWFEEIMHRYAPESSWDLSPELYMNVADNTDLRAFEEEIRLLDARTNPNGYLMIWNTQIEREETESSQLILAIFLYGFVVLIALIGVTNIFNTISTNVALRRREFAMLKSVGMTPAGFSRMLNYECIFYGLKALLYGLPVGIALSYWLYTSISDVFYFSFVLPWREIAICVLGVFMIVFLTMLHASSKLKKENIIDALKTENL